MLMNASPRYFKCRPGHGLFIREDSLRAVRVNPEAVRPWPRHVVMNDKGVTPFSRHRLSPQCQTLARPPPRTMVSGPRPCPKCNLE